LNPITTSNASEKERIMKPTLITIRDGKRFPLIDCDYRPMTLDRFRGRCVRSGTPRFRNISAQYFQNEARHDFLAEAVCFVAIIITAAAPLISAASAVAELSRAFAQI
jgi:hypothetical protein